MFDGEMASLSAICATRTICCPKPIKVLDISKGGAMLVTDYIEMRSLRQHAAILGDHLARYDILQKLSN